MRITLTAEVLWEGYLLRNLHRSSSGMLSLKSFARHWSWSSVFFTCSSSLSLVARRVSAYASAVASETSTMESEVS